MRGMGAIDGNKALFAYRQVQPVDPVLVRNFLEGMLRSFVFLLFICGGLMLGLEMYPDNAIRVVAAWLSLWSLGLGLEQLEYSFRRGLMQNYVPFSVCTEQALNYACLLHKVTLSDEQKAQLLARYRCQGQENRHGRSGGSAA